VSRTKAADWLGTAGWAAKGVLYLLVAVLALQLALSGGTDNEQASKQGAMQSLVDKPLGSALLAIVVVGLFSYALYRLLAVFLPRPGRNGGQAEERAHQLVHLGSAVAYAAFGVQGVSLLLGRGSGGGDTQQQTWSAVALSSTAGTVALLAVGVGFIAFGGWQVHRAVNRSFLDKLDCPGGSMLNRRSIEWIGVTGLSARAAVSALLGLFVVLSVWRHDPGEVRGLDGALRALLAAPAGPPLLAAVAIGLAAYGAFSLVSAHCRRHELG
jgi:hypothetical protein